MYDVRWMMYDIVSIEKYGPWRNCRGQHSLSNCIKHETFSPQEEHENNTGSEWGVEKSQKKWTSEVEIDLSTLEKNSKLYAADRETFSLSFGIRTNFLPNFLCVNQS